MVGRLDRRGPRHRRLENALGLILLVGIEAKHLAGSWPGSGDKAQSILEAAVAGTSPVEATDHLGVVHRMWSVSDVGIISKLAAELGPQPLFIADGHHRYETACNYRDELAAAAGGPLPPGHPANFVLMMFVGLHDPGLIVMPTHRLFRGLPPLSSGELIQKLGPHFTTRIAGEGSDLAPTIWDEIETDGEQGTLGLFTQADEQQGHAARLTDAGRRRMAEVAAERSADWRNLGDKGSCMLHRLVIDTLLAAPTAEAAIRASSGGSGRRARHGRVPAGRPW